MATIKKLSAYLDPTLIKDDYEWLQVNSPQFIPAIEGALQDGHKPQDIYQRYMHLSPSRQALWVRVKHAAMYIEQMKDKGVTA